jgi:hypothetical protein
MVSIIWTTIASDALLGSPNDMVIFHKLWAHLIASLGEFSRYVRFTKGLNSKPYSFKAKISTYDIVLSEQTFEWSNLSIDCVHSNTQFVINSSSPKFRITKKTKKNTSPMRMQTFSFAFVRSRWKIVLFMLLINSIQSFIYLLSNFKRSKPKCYLPSSQQNHSVHYSVGIIISSNDKLYPNFFPLGKTQST